MVGECITLPDFSKRLERCNVALMNVTLRGNALEGMVATSEHMGLKKVTIRWTDTNWVTLSNTAANQTQPNLFLFHIERIEGRTIKLAVQYVVTDNEYWDNNFCQDFTF